MQISKPITQTAYILRIEGLVLLVVASLLYFVNGWSGWLFLLLLIVPDISFLGYLRNDRLGAVVYNLGHTFTSPLILMSLTTLINRPWGYRLGLIWLAHIGLDRLLGQGFKQSQPDQL